jgi:hypothetical protein
MDMGTADMVGSMGLTFFCNSFVEVLFDFERTGNAAQPLTDMCKYAASSFESLKSPEGEMVHAGDRAGLFGTEEDIRCFEQVLSRQQPGDFSFLDKLVCSIRQVAQGNDLNARREQAKALREFFDALGDCSVYITRDRLRDSVAEMI